MVKNSNENKDNNNNRTSQAQRYHSLRHLSTCRIFICLATVVIFCSLVWIINKGKCIGAKDRKNIGNIRYYGNKSTKLAQFWILAAMTWQPRGTGRHSLFFGKKKHADEPCVITTDNGIDVAKESHRTGPLRHYSDGNANRLPSIRPGASFCCNLELLVVLQKSFDCSAFCIYPWLCSFDQCQRLLSQKQCVGLGPSLMFLWGFPLCVPTFFFIYSCRANLSLWHEIFSEEGSRYKIWRYKIRSFRDCFCSHLRTSALGKSRKWTQSFLRFWKMRMFGKSTGFCSKSQLFRDNPSCCWLLPNVEVLIAWEYISRTRKLHSMYHQSSLSVSCFCVLFSQKQRKLTEAEDKSVSRTAFFFSFTEFWVLRLREKDTQIVT